jgi:GAF domain-containing protein
MKSGPPASEAIPRESDLALCLTAIARSLDAGFEPRAFLNNFSAALQPFVPHDRLGIGFLSDDGRTYSVFAEHSGSGFLPPTDRYTTDLRGPTRFAVADSPLAPVFEGRVLCVPGLPSDPRFADHAAQLRSTGLKSATFVPLLSGSRVVGELSAATRVAAVHSDANVERLRTVGRMIGPFIELIALLYRETRRRQRMDRLTGITKMLGTTLDLRAILAPLGEAVRPAIAFDAMGVIIFDTSDGQWTFFGTAGERPAPGIERIPAREFSYGPSLIAGRTVLFDDASKEVNLAFAGDRVLLTAGLQSCLWVPMHFGDEVGGSLFFGKHEPRSYDSVDVEVATVVSGRVVLGIQHQRLAEEQRRLASAERRARTLEQTLKTTRSELHARYGFEQMIGRSPLFRERPRSHGPSRPRSSPGRAGRGRSSSRVRFTTRAHAPRARSWR